MRNFFRFKFVFLIVASLLLVSACAKEVASDPTKLSTPTITAVNETTVSWNEISGAVAYDLNVDGLVTQITSTTYEVSEYGTYIIKVRAIAEEDGVYLNSDWSEPFTLNYEEEVIIPELDKISAPIIDVEDYSTIYWLPVVAANGYRVYVNGQAVTPDLSEDQRSFSISDKDFGIYKLEVQALPANSELYAPSDMSNELELELINPTDYAERLGIRINGNPLVILGEKTTYEFELFDKNSKDISFLSEDITWSISENETFASIDQNGNLEGLVKGTIKIKATHTLYSSIIGELEVEVIDKPTMSVELDNYDKQADLNNAVVTTSVPGIIHYINLNEVPTDIEAFLSMDLESANVDAGVNTVNIDFGSPAGKQTNLYFVLEYIVEGHSIGYSDLFSIQDLELLVGITKVSDALGLYEALQNNDEAIELTNDISLTGVWTQVTTIFTGVLDGKNYTISNLVVEGESTGLIKFLGDGATFQNIIFKDAIAREFNGGYNGIIAHSISEDATIVFDNVVLENAKTISSVAGGSRSTHGALIAVVDFQYDTQTSITLKNVYIDYTHDITRETDTWNVGGVFGKFRSVSPTALTLEGVYLNVKMNPAGANAGNAGAIAGIGVGHIVMNNSVIKFSFIPTEFSAGPQGLDLGYLYSDLGIYEGGNNVLISSTSTLNGSWADLNNTNKASLLEVESSILTLLAEAEGSPWSNDNGSLSIMISGKTYQIPVETKLDTVTLGLADTVISWDSVTNAVGYNIYVDGEFYKMIKEETSFDTKVLAGGTRTIAVQTVGDQIEYVSSDLSEAIEVEVEQKDKLATPNIILNENILTWDSILNAISYKVLLNDEVISTLTETTIDLSSYVEKGWNRFTVQAIADVEFYSDSNMSLEVEINDPYMVSDATELAQALTANQSYITLANDIVLEGVWTQIETTFTGVLDGNGHTIQNLLVEGSQTGMFKTLGDRATFRNIVFLDAKATNFDSGEEFAILSYTLEDEAHVLFENVSLVNAKTVIDQDTGLSKTHGALVAIYYNKTDEKTSVELRNVYIEYTVEISSSDKIYNVGGLFGKYRTASLNALIMDGVYLDVRIDHANGEIENVGAIAGGGPQYMTLTNTIIRFNYHPLGIVVKNHIDNGYGYYSGEDFNGENNIFISFDSELDGDWNILSYRLEEMFLTIDPATLVTFTTPESPWSYVEGILSFTVLNQDYNIDMGSKLDTPSLTIIGEVISWQAIPNAVAYGVYLNGELHEILTNETTFDAASLDDGTYLITVNAIGDNIDFASSDLSESEEVVINHKALLATPAVTLTEKVLTWDAIQNAVSYQIVINDEIISSLTETTIDLTSHLDKGIYNISVKAIADPEVYQDSELSEIEYIDPYLVSDSIELAAALTANYSYIKLENDIVLEGVWTQIDTTFTGVLDGDGYTIQNLLVEGSQTGMFKTLGNGATLKNICFLDATATNFDAGEEFAIIAYTVEDGAQVLFENMSLINAKTIINLDNGASKTHGALIAIYYNSADEETSVKLKNVYIDYTVDVTRTSSVYNVGGLFGKYRTASMNGLILDSVFLDIKINPENAKVENVGAIAGGGNKYMTFTNTVVIFDYDPEGIAGKDNLDIGYSYYSSDGVYQGAHNVFLSETSQLEGNWPSEVYSLYQSTSDIDFTTLNETLGLSSSWTITIDSAYLTICGQQYILQ